LPLPIPIGCVSEAPAPVVEIVSVGVDDTTDVSVVGKFPPTAVPFGLTAAGELVGALVVEETTDASSVGNFCAALAAGEVDADGELEGPAPPGPSFAVDATEGVPPFSAVVAFC
jgi:hypothetical protein